MIKKLKKFISFNLLAIYFWFTFITFMINLRSQSIYEAGSGFPLFLIFYGFFSLGIFAIIGWIFIIEFICDFRIKNKFILENKFYNLFFNSSWLLIFFTLFITSNSL